MAVSHLAKRKGCCSVQVACGIENQCRAPSPCSSSIPLENPDVYAVDFARMPANQLSKGELVGG